MNLRHTASLDELIQKHPCFQSLEDVAIWEYETDYLCDFLRGKRTDAPKSTKYRCNVPDLEFFDHLPQISILSVMFIGKTGYGKSSLLNQIIGHPVFKTDDIHSCTKEIDSSVFRLGSDPRYYLSLNDLPGIGENKAVDENYMAWYAELLLHSPSVVYVLRADQRDWTLDEQVFKNLFAKENSRDKVIIALNCADKIEPVSRSKYLSEQQLEALEHKVDLISEFFDIPSYRIFPCCALTGYGIEDLLAEVAEDLEQCVFDPE